MRSEQEMMELILGTARKREDIRAVFLNGSRANPNAPRDIFQDYDIVYAMTDPAPWTEDLSWLTVFGEELIFQFPALIDKALSPTGPVQSRFTCLMQFTDGNRIDLTLLPLEELESYLKEDSETVLLLDKDNRVGELPPPSDRDYWVSRPSEAEYLACCNEFYWLIPYVCKGLWRQELPYAPKEMETGLRPMFIRMLSWQAGTETGFCFSVGKGGKYMKNYLDGETMRRFCATYPAGRYETAWEALLEMRNLFADSARLVGKALKFSFPEMWRERVERYAEAVKNLPDDAVDFPGI